MKNVGTNISKILTPIAAMYGSDCVNPETGHLNPTSNCGKMVNDFDNAQYVKDYGRAILDRIRKRGKYAK